MRPIQFRAFDIQNKRMSTPFKITDIMGGESYGSALPCTIDAGFEILLYELDDPNKYELMQFTGLHDKNRREIYERDIVELFGWGSQTESDGYSLVEWDKDITGWNFNRYTYAEDRYNFLKAIANCVIVGNLYENPELLTK